MIVSIHQPNYLPWLGFFDKIKRSDLFVIMDDVQFPRGKQHFGHRNLIKTNNAPKWLTLPIVDRSAMRPFNETQINYDVPWQEEHLNLIKHFYGKAPFFKEYFYHVEFILKQRHSSISALNIVLFRWMCHELDIRTRFIRSSHLAPDTHGFGRIKEILTSSSATEYISGNGPGSMRYLEQDWFDENNVKLTWQNFEHPIYTQQHGTEFVPNLCALDLLFNEGPNAKNLI